MIWNRLSTALEARGVEIETSRLSVTPVLIVVLRVWHWPLGGWQIEARAGRRRLSVMVRSSSL